MANTKKSFKNNAENLNKLFSQNESQSNDTDKTQDTLNMSNTQITHNAQDSQNKFYRFNLKMPLDYKEFLDDIAWKNRKTITQYINDLIKNEMERKN